MNIHKSTLRTPKNILALCAFAVAISTGCSCCQRAAQQKKEASEYDRNTMATLIDKKITKDDNNKNHVIFWLDSDNDRKTAEGFCAMPNAPHEKTSHISSITNGTTKSLAEWRKIAHPYEVSHNPCEFLQSR